jgi:2-methylcitrate dehydratase
MSDEPLIRRLAKWVAAFDAGKIPADVIMQAKLLLLDTLGCAVAARQEQAFEAAFSTVAEIGGTSQCTIIGTRERTSLPNAVLLNGTLIRALDLNDIYTGPRQNGHPSDNIAVALAFAEWQRSTGAQLLNAILLDYEMYCRFNDLTDPGGFWDHATVSGLVAPAIAGRLLNLDTGKLADAMAISAAHGVTLSGVRSGQLSAAKNTANALVASNAALITLLAKNGLTGPSEILDGPRGLAKAVLPDADLTPLLRPVEAPYRLMNVTIKAYPCIGTGQTTVAAAVQARSLIKDPLRDIQSISVRMAGIPFVRRQLEDPQRRHPRTRETADHSFYYLAAAGLLDGGVTVAGFKKQRWLDADINELMERITFIPDERLNQHMPGTFPCVLEMTTRSGERKTVEMIHAPGSVKNRMTRAQVEAKFRNSCAAGLPEEQQGELILQVMDLERLDSVAALMKNLQPWAQRG